MWTLSAAQAALTLDGLLCSWWPHPAPQPPPRAVPAHVHGTSRQRNTGLSAVCVMSSKSASPRQSRFCLSCQYWGFGALIYPFSHSTDSQGPSSPKVIFNHLVKLKIINSLNCIFSNTTHEFFGFASANI